MSSNTVSQLYSLAEQAREQRLSGPHKNNTEFPLVGKCFDNALVLYNILEREGFQPTFMVGTTKRVADPLLQEGINLQSDVSEIADLGGHVHFWVECEVYIIDIASDTHDMIGEILIEKDPDNYYWYTNSESYAEETRINAINRRCSYCGAHQYHCSHSP